MNTLTWFELSKLPAGTRVVFTAPVDRFSENLIIPINTTGTITEQGLNEIWCALCIKPDDATIQAALHNWDGDIVLNPQNDGEGMQSLSPLSALA